MTWLDEIESRHEYDSEGWIPSNTKTIYDQILDDAHKDRGRMARVIRELVKHLKDAKAWGEHAGIYLVDIDDIALMQLCEKARDSWDNLSPDTKELLE